MSLYQFLASDSELLEVNNPYKKILSINEAINSGVHLDEFILNSDIDRDKRVLLYCDSEEHFHEVEIHKEESSRHTDNYTTKKYCSVLSWGCNNLRAEQLVEYIKQHLTKADIIELWNIWLGDEEEEPIINYCKIDELTVEDIRNIWGQDGFIKPECLIVEK